MPTLFTRIINGEIPSHKICEDENYIAFLEIRPINPGHTLVVLKKETDYFFDVDDRSLGGMIVFAKKVSRAIQKEMKCKRVGVMVAGLEIPHAHLHLIPIFGTADLNFDNARPADHNELAKVAERIRKHL